MISGLTVPSWTAICFEETKRLFERGSLKVNDKNCKKKLNYFNSSKQKKEPPLALCRKCGSSMFKKEDILVLEGNKVNIKIEPDALRLGNLFMPLK